MNNRESHAHGIPSFKRNSERESGRERGEDRDGRGPIGTRSQMSWLSFACGHNGHGVDEHGEVTEVDTDDQPKLISLYVDGSEYPSVTAVVQKEKKEALPVNQGKSDNEAYDVIISIG